MLSPGQVIERYTIDRLLGQGGMAVVYRVTHQSLGSFHALKILTMSSPAIRERLLQEGRVQASLRHPNIVAVTDVLDVDGAPGLVMEYIEGPSLDDFLRDNRPSYIEAERLFRAIVSAVQHAHAQGVIHRDLKPANVMLAPASGSWVPKVADFGLAKALVEDGGGLQQTRSGMAMGTPAYMAPEQIRDAKNVDGRADVFSLGCILYELCCGRPAFSGPDILSIFNAVASGTFQAPVSLVPDLPAHIQAAIQGCLDVDRDRRIPDCTRLLAVLDGEAFEPSAPQGVPAPGQTWLGDEAQAALGAGGAVGLAVAKTQERAQPATSLDGSLVPKAGRSLSGSMPGKKVGAILGVGVIGVAAVAGLALVGAGVGGWLWLDHTVERRVATFLRDQTAGEVTVGDVAWRPGGALLTGVVVHGPDGSRLAEAERVELRGSFGGASWQLDGVHIGGLSVDLRRAEAGWVVPPMTAARFEGRVEGPDDFRAVIGTLTTGPVVVVATAPGGTLTTRWSELQLRDLALGLDTSFSWEARGAQLTGLAIAGADDVLSVGDASFDGGALELERLEAWLRLGDGGVPALPPVIADRFADWAGGTLDKPVTAPWAGLGVAWLPIRPDRLQVRSGTVHVLDPAHPAEPVQWDIGLDHLTVGPVANGRLPINLGGRASGGSVGFQADLSEQGLLKGRLSARNLPLTALTPYLHEPLVAHGVEVAGGTVEATVVLSVRGNSWAGALDADIAAPKLVMAPPGAGGGSVRPVRLLADREKVEVHEQYQGNLTDASFSPVAAVLQDLSDALFAPARRVAPTRAPSPPPAAPAAPAAPTPVVRDTPDEKARPAVEEEPAPDTPKVRETVDRWNRDVRDALDELRGMRR